MKKPQYKKTAIAVAAIALLGAALLLFMGRRAGDGRSVILIIGDGMGENAISLAAQTGELQHLKKENFDFYTTVTTFSANSTVPDSCTAGSAMATGVKARNYAMGVSAKAKVWHFLIPKNVTELAASLGKPAGIVTTGMTNEGTPTAFSAHASTRYDEEAVAKSQMKSPLTLLWGAPATVLYPEQLEKKGYTILTTAEELRAEDRPDKTLGQFEGELWRRAPGEETPALKELFAQAVKTLEKGGNGFFLLAENDHIDQFEEVHDRESTVEALLSLDETVGAALAYAESHDNVLLIVTADHETGGLVQENGEYTFTADTHTGADVPVYIKCADESVFAGDISDNTDIAKLIAGWWGKKLPACSIGFVK